MKYRKYVWLVLLLFLSLSALLRVRFLINNFDNFSILFSDDAIYMQMAEDVASGGFARAIHPHWSPLYPLITGFVSYLTNNVVATGSFVSIISLLSLSVPVYFLTEKLTNGFFGLLAVINLVVFDKLVGASFMQMTETLYVFLFWSAIALSLLSLKSRSRISVLVAGTVWGLCILTRVEGLFAFMAFLFVVLLCWIAKKKNRKCKFLTRYIGGLIFAVFVVYSSYQAALYTKYGGFPTGTKTSAYYTLSDPYILNESKDSTWAQDIYGLDSFNINSEFKTNVLEYFVRYWRSLLAAWSLKLVNGLHIVFSFFSLPFLLLTFFGVIVSFLNRNEYSLIFCGALLLNYIILSFFLPQLEERYYYWLIPFFIIYFYVGLFGLVKWVRFRFVLFLLLFVASIVNFYIARNKLLFRLKDNRKGSVYSISKSPEFISLIDGKTVMLQHEGIAYYADIKHIYTPLVETLDELLKYAKLKRVDYLLVAHGETPPHLKYLYEAPKNYPGLELVFQDRVVVYKLKP